MMVAKDQPSQGIPMLTFLTIIGTIATIIAAAATVITMRRTPKLPDPPYQPSIIHLEGVTMHDNTRDLIGHGWVTRPRRIR